jgi:hypothetical protein
MKKFVIPISIAVLAFLSLAATMWAYCAPSLTSFGYRKGPPMLSNREEAALRKSVYKNGLSTTIAAEGPWAGHRIVVVPIQVSELHKKNRVAVLCLLLEILRGARQQEALTAAAFAIALEKSPIRALPCATYEPDTIDLVTEDEESTGRQALVRGLEEIIAKARKGE